MDIIPVGDTGKFASPFSSSPSHIEKAAQKESCFQDIPQDLCASDACHSSETSDGSLILKGRTASELSEVAYEAKSYRDRAWYDVAAFLSHRVLSTGDLEVRVRFAGFGVSHDEWVNVKYGVRQRSVPLELSECHKVKVGDLVLCFQERLDYAVYVDAHVMEIHRKLHDIKGCRCIFVVRFDDDKTEEKVQLDKICCRPS